MREGGISNNSISSRLRLIAEYRKAYQINKVELKFYAIPFRLLFDEKTRQGIPSVTEWFNNVCAIPAFHQQQGNWFD